MPFAGAGEFTGALFLGGAGALYGPAGAEGVVTRAPFSPRGQRTRTTPASSVLALTVMDCRLLGLANSYSEFQGRALHP
jgi:hypothetical protein